MRPSAMQVYKAVHVRPDTTWRQHQHPICHLIYNPVYQKAIAAEGSGLICLWKVSLSMTVTLLLLLTAGCTIQDVV